MGVVVSLSSERRPHRSAADSMECHLIPVEEFEDPTMKQITQFIDICDRARQAKKVCMCVSANILTIITKIIMVDSNNDLSLTEIIWRAIKSIQ